MSNTHYGYLILSYLFKLTEYLIFTPHQHVKVHVQSKPFTCIHTTFMAAESSQCFQSLG